MKMLIKSFHIDFLLNYITEILAVVIGILIGIILVLHWSNKRIEKKSSDETVKEEL